MDFASRGCPGGSLEALLERLGGLLGRLEAIWGAFERFIGDSGTWWAVSKGLWRLAEGFWTLPGAPRSARKSPGRARNPRDSPGRARNPQERPGKPGVRAPKNLSAPLPLRAAGLHEPWGTPLRAEGKVADIPCDTRVRAAPRREPHISRMIRPQHLRILQTFKTDVRGAKARAPF